MNPDGVRDYDLLVPAMVEALVIERHASARDRLPGARPTPGATAFIAEHGVIAASPATREGPPPARRRGQASASAARRATVGEIGVGPRDPARRRAGRHRGDRARPGPDVASSCGSSATRTAGPTARWSTSAGRSWSSRSSRSTRTRAAAAGRASRARAAPDLAERLLPGGSPPRCGGSASRSATGRFGAEMAGRARQRRPVHDLARHGPALRSAGGRRKMIGGPRRRTGRARRPVGRGGRSVAGDRRATWRTSSSVRRQRVQTSVLVGTPFWCR